MCVLAKASNVTLFMMLQLGCFSWTTAHGYFIGHPALPIFVDDTPRNQTAKHGLQVVFQCRVYSAVYMTIKWFRKLPDQRQIIGKILQTPKALIHYEGASYELLHTNTAKALGNHTYLSKLVINRVDWLDEGVYICAGINLHGHRIREAHLRVTADDKSIEMNFNTRKYWLLFLIPIGLASLPTGIWLSYALYKGRRVKAAPNDFQEQI